MRVKIVIFINVLISAFLGCAIYPIVNKIQETVFSGDGMGNYIIVILILFLLCIICKVLINFIFRILLKIIGKSEWYEVGFSFIFNSAFALAIFVYAIYYHYTISEWNIVLCVFMGLIKITPVLLTAVPIWEWGSTEQPKTKRIKATTFNYGPGMSQTTYRDQDTGQEVKIDHWKF